MRQLSPAKRQRHIAHALVNDLKACTMKKDLTWGREIHEKAMESQTYSNKYVVSGLIRMYAKCGSMAEARRVFDSTQEPDVVSWTALLLGYTDNGEGRSALDLFSGMKSRGCEADPVTYVAALKACTSVAAKGDRSVKADCLERGRKIHSEIGCNLDQYVQGALIEMYVKCGSVLDARRVFDSIEKPNVVSWTVLLLGYAEKGDGQAALQLFSTMKARGLTPDAVAYIAALKSCTSLAITGSRRECLERGREIHSEIGSQLDRFVQNTLIDMYANGGSMSDAHRVFDGIQNPGVVSWNALLLGYAENGEGLATLDLFSSMKASGCTPDAVTYVAAIKACGLTGALVLGRKIHAEIIDFTTHVVTCLVDFYAKCGSMVEARNVFDLHKIRRTNPAWNSLLAGYGSFGELNSVFEVFKLMQDDGFRPDAVTFVCLLLSCSHAGLVDTAKEYFDAMPGKYGVTPTILHYTCMVDILGRANQLSEAIAVLREMPCRPDAVTWRALLAACCKWKNIEIGRLVVQFLIGLDKTSGVGAAHVLMSHIYGNGSSRVSERPDRLEMKVDVAEAYVTDEMGVVVKFQDSLESTVGPCKSFDFGEEASHVERRAVVYGILKTPPGDEVRVFKNTKMCEGCHESTKMFSKLLNKVLMVRDATRFHVMVDGKCWCGE